MEEQGNLTQDDILDLIGGEGFKYEPVFNKVIITLNKEEIDGGLVLSDNVVSDEQYVVAIGDTVRAFKAGQKVLVDVEKLMVTVPNTTDNVYESTKQLKLDFLEVDGMLFAIIEDRYIKAKVRY